MQAKKGVRTIKVSDTFFPGNASEAGPEPKKVSDTFFRSDTFFPL